jgi:hypothetical protein
VTEGPESTVMRDNSGRNPPPNILPAKVRGIKGGYERCRGMIIRNSPACQGICSAGRLNPSYPKRETVGMRHEANPPAEVARLLESYGEQVRRAGASNYMFVHNSHNPSYLKRGIEWHGAEASNHIHNSPWPL